MDDKMIDEKIREFEKGPDCCGNCRFYTHDPEPSPNGQCRESSPQCVAIPQQVPVMDKDSLLIGGKVQMQMQIVVNGYFPPTAPNIWCGKHKPRIN